MDLAADSRASTDATALYLHKSSQIQNFPYFQEYEGDVEGRVTILHDLCTETYMLVARVQALHSAHAKKTKISLLYTPNF